MNAHTMAPVLDAYTRLGLGYAILGVPVNMARFALSHWLEDLVP